MITVVGVGTPTTAPTVHRRERDTPLDGARDAERRETMRRMTKGATATGRRSPGVPGVAAALASPLRHLDTVAVSQAARAESRNREIHLPPVSTYRWWARRTESVNGAIIDAVGKDHDDQRLLVADPFAGGGVIPLAALIRGHQVYAQDLNPWAAAGLTAMLGLPRADALRDATAVLAQLATPLVDAAYATELSDGSAGHISHTFRVATAPCSGCGKRSRLFPHALVSLLARRERRQAEAFLACRNGHVFLGREDRSSRCTTCRARTDPAASYTPNRTVTCSCGHVERLERRAASGGWSWEVVLVERARRGRRELALPTDAERGIADSETWVPRRDLGSVPDGQETRVLRRHGFEEWADLYPRRQRVLLERLLEMAPRCSKNPHVVAAVTMAIVGSAEMAGHLSRWDRYYLKSYESMAGHRFNFTTLSVEPNVWGTPTSGRGTATRRLAQFVKAAEWLHRQAGDALDVRGPVGNASRRTRLTEDVRVAEGSSERMVLPTASADLVLTDPPYHDDVQYAELSLPLRAWAQLSDSVLLGEAVVNTATGQLADVGAYEALLTRIFREARRALRADGHLIFSYANRSPEAWVSLLSALQHAGLRAVGAEVVHSENETDHAKRGVRACTLDLIMDLVPTGELPVSTHLPARAAASDEERFLAVVVDTFLHVGRLSDGWQQRLIDDLRQTSFLAQA
jgi:16S rRNA G966 N2-methylase RsmD